MTVGLFPEIGGTELITTDGTYTWPALVSAGQPPFIYRWYYYRPPPAEQQVSTANKYSRYVTTSSTPYTFRLRLVVTDNAGVTDSTWDYIEVVRLGDGGAVAPSGAQRQAVGVRDAAGACQPLPDERKLRRRAFDAIVASGRWPEPCVYWR